MSSLSRACLPKVLLLAVVILLLLPSSSASASGAGDPTVPAAPHTISGTEVPLGPRALGGWALAWGIAPSSGLVGQGGGFAASSNATSAVLFGGVDLSSALSNSTAVYNETTNGWTALPSGPPWPPSPRTEFAFGGDPLLQEDVLFGGETNLTTDVSDNQTWLFYTANHTWREVVRPTAPAPRQDAAFAVAPYLGTALLFGGWNESGSVGEVIYKDTWTLNLSTDLWTSVTPGGSGAHPPALHGASLLWDSSTHRFELFGGCDPCSNALWSYDPWNSTWTQEAVAGAPVGRENAVWIYDPVQDLDVLFGGQNPATGPFSDAWTLNPSTLSWTQDGSSPGPVARYGAAATWLSVPTNETLLVAGGNNGVGPLSDLWRFAPTSTIDVQLRDAVTQQPLRSGTVTVDGTMSVGTDLHGFGNVSAAPSGGTRVEGTQEGYEPRNASLWVEPGISPRLVILNLTPNPHANLTVQVLSPSGAPLGGIDVNVTVLGSLFVNPPPLTNAQGFANYTGLPANVTFLLTAWQFGYRADRAVLSLLPRQDLSWTFTLAPLPVLVFRAWGQDEDVAGAAFPYPDAWVWLNGTIWGRTGSSGYYNVSLNATGPLATEATSVDCGNGYDNVSLPYTGTVFANATLAPLDPSALDVHVVANGSLLPLAGVDVNDSFSNGLERIQFTTDSEGYSNTTLLRAGPNSLTIWLAGYGPQKKSFFFDPADTIFYNVTLFPLPVLHLRVWGLNVQNRTVALRGAAVYWNGAPTGTTGAGGWLNYTPARPGPVELYATLTDYNASTLVLTINATGVRWANMTLVHLPWAILSVQALDRDNDEPLVGATATGYMPDGTTNATSTNHHGYANLTTVPGWANATATYPDFYPASGMVLLEKYRSELLRLPLVPYPVVHIRVLAYNASGPMPPLSGVEVEFDATIVGYTDSGGWFNESNFAEGSENITVSTPLYISGHRMVHLNYTGPLNVTFFLTAHPLATVHAHLFDGYTGLPVPYADANLTNVGPEPTTPGSDRTTSYSGWANFTSLGAGNYTLTGFHTGYHLSVFDIEGTATSYGLNWGQVLWVNLTLVPLPYCSVYAEVRDKNTSAPIDGAQVVIGYAYGATSNAEGNATFPTPYVPGGDYVVIASATGYYTWQSNGPMDFPEGNHVELPIWLLPAPKVKCNSTSQPGCSQNNQYTKGNFSLLPFASGPFWPFLVLPPLFLLGALAYFAISRRRSQDRRPPPGVVVVAPPPPRGPLPP